MAVVEIVRFRSTAGTNTEKFLQENERVRKEYTSRQHGFIGRELAQSDDSEWLVIVRWESGEDADASMGKFMGDPATQSFVAMLDNSTYSMKRYTVI